MEKTLIRQGQEGMRLGAKERKEDGVLKGAGREEELSMYDVCGLLPCGVSEIHWVYVPTICHFGGDVPN